MKVETSAEVCMKVNTGERPVTSGGGDLTKGYMKERDRHYISFSRPVMKVDTFSVHLMKAETPVPSA